MSLRMNADLVILIRKGSAKLARLRNDIVPFPSPTMYFNIATIGSWLHVVKKSLRNRASVAHACIKAIEI